MDCTSARDLLHDARRGRLDPAGAAEVRAHLEGCAGCRREDEAEGLLDAALSTRLPRPAAPPALRRRVEALVAEAAAPRAEPPAAPAPVRLRRWAWPAAAAALALLSTGLLLERGDRGRADAGERLAGELVSDHLRALALGRLDVESTDTHQVKPWFEGRLDFAPQVPPDGGELRLLGGGVGYVLDRKAAVMSYALRRHRVTLLAFPAAGLPVPAAGGTPVRAASLRGFDVMLWREGELAYALVADVAPAELEQLAARLEPSTRR